jgi:hypothetical protein
VLLSAVLLGLGIVSMHYVGMHGSVRARSAMTHDGAFVALSVLIAIAAAYGGLRAFLARHGGVQLMLSAIAFGDCGVGHALHGDVRACVVHRAEVISMAKALRASPQISRAGGCAALLRDRGRLPAVTGAGRAQEGDGRSAAGSGWSRGQDGTWPAPRLRAMPLGGMGQPRPIPAPRLPVEGADGTHFIDAADIRSVRADAHYTKVHDGTRERMCPWSISEAEAQLDPACSSGCTAATSWRSRTSPSSARRATVR